MRFASLQYWNNGLGSFPLWEKASDREPLHPDEYFWQQTKRAKFRAKVRSRHRRQLHLRLNLNLQLKNIENGNWGIF